MKKLLNYIIILSLPLFVFGCRELTDASSSLMNDSSETSSEVISGPTIDADSDEFDYIEETEKGIIHYKGVPFNGSVTETYDNGQLKEKRTWENNQPLSTYEMFYTNGQLKEKQLNGNLVESYLENGDPQE